MSKTLSRFVEPKDSGISNPLRQTIRAPTGPELFGGVGGIDSFASLTHPCGARFARPNRRAGLSNPIDYFEGSNVELF